MTTLSFSFDGFSGQSIEATLSCNNSISSSIKLTKEGFDTEPQVVNLKENESRELTFVLEPATEKPNRKNGKAE